MTYRSSLLPGIPLVESPLFEAELEHMGLSPAERKIALDLNRDGYAVLEFPDPDINNRVARIRRNLAPELGIEDDKPEAIKLGGKGRVQDAWRHDEDVKAIAANPVILDLLSRLYGRRAFPFQTLNFPVGSQQQAHTDIVHFSSVPERFMCGVWLALEDVTIDAGPLFYVPGSHKWPAFTNTMIGRRGWGQPLESAQIPYHEVWRAMSSASKSAQVQFMARKGQAFIWTANLLHGGSPQTNPTRTRWSQVTHYFFDDCVYYTPAFSDEPLGRLKLRQIVDVESGTRKPNLYLGEQIKPRPAAFPRRLWTQVTRATRKVIGR